MVCKILKIFAGIVFVVFLCSGTVVNAETFYYANGHRIQWEDETWLNGICYRAIKKLSQFSPVPMEKLDNAKLLHWNLTDEQYAGAYGEALQIAQYAVGKGLECTMAPQILDTNGRAVYGKENIDIDFAVSNGLVEYSKDLSMATSGSSRAGNNPLVIKATGVRGGTNSVNPVNVVVSPEDADKILLAAQNNPNMFRDGAVVFVR